VLDLVPEFLGPTGENSLQDAAGDVQGRSCLLGALIYIERKHRISSFAAHDSLKDASTGGT
jgi:hypothetical protein